MIFGINITRDISKLSQNYVLQFWNITRGIYAKYLYKTVYYLYKSLSFTSPQTHHDSFFRNETFHFRNHLPAVCISCVAFSQQLVELMGQLLHWVVDLLKLHFLFQTKNKKGDKLHFQTSPARVKYKSQMNGITRDFNSQRWKLKDPITMQSKYMPKKEKRS